MRKTFWSDIRQRARLSDRQARFAPKTPISVEMNSKPDSRRLYLHIENLNYE